MVGYYLRADRFVQIKKSKRSSISFFFFQQTTQCAIINYKSTFITKLTLLHEQAKYCLIKKTCTLTFSILSLRKLIFPSSPCTNITCRGLQSRTSCNITIVVDRGALNILADKNVAKKLNLLSQFSSDRRVQDKLFQKHLIIYIEKNYV